MTEGAMAEGAMAEGAMAEGAMAEGAMAEGAVWVKNDFIFGTRGRDMDLVEAFRATEAAVAVVGAGGKKTTMYALADRLDRAIVTATVRIPIFDDEVAAVRVTADPASASRDPDAGNGSIGLVPERERADRYRGYDPSVVDDLITTHDGPVLVKADGARLREFKAPNGTEPRIPSLTDVVVPVVSVGVVGEPLGDDLVHRPERVIAVARDAGLDVSVGDPITAELVGTVLADPEGGLKGVPERAVVVPLINKVDDDERERSARRIAETIRRRVRIRTDRGEAATNVPVPHVVLGRLLDGTVVDVVPVDE